jgi:hypothetical protein
MPLDQKNIMADVMFPSSLECSRLVPSRRAAEKLKPLAIKFLLYSVDMLTPVTPTFRTPMRTVNRYLPNTRYGMYTPAPYFLQHQHLQSSNNVPPPTKAYSTAAQKPTATNTNRTAAFSLPNTVSVCPVPDVKLLHLHP